MGALRQGDRGRMGARISNSANLSLEEGAIAKIVVLFWEAEHWQKEERGKIF